MKLAFALLLLAQLTRHDSFVATLNADLMARNVNQFASDLNSLYPRGVINRGLATALSQALGDRELSQDSLTPLVNGILAGFDAAFAWKGHGSGLLESDDFRDAIKQIYYPLTRLGVSVSETQGFLRLYYQTANRIAHPILQPVPR